MTFKQDARLDPDQVTDVRGRAYGGGRGIAIGGGGIGLVIALVYLLLGGNPADLAGRPGRCHGARGLAAHPGMRHRRTRRTTGADCRIVGFVNSIQAYWTDAYAEDGGSYQPAQTFIFDGGVDTGCGPATSAVGPFYCPPDQSIYLDLGFFDELQSRFGARGRAARRGLRRRPRVRPPHRESRGPAHGGGGGIGAESRSVRMELMADCFAGVWVYHAASTGFLEPPTAARSPRP